MTRYYDEDDIYTKKKLPAQGVETIEPELKIAKMAFAVNGQDQMSPKSNHFRLSPQNIFLLCYTNVRRAVFNNFNVQQSHCQTDTSTNKQDKKRT